ncbi:MAG: Yip1 family protein [Thermoleophilia bacterium]
MSTEAPAVSERRLQRDWWRRLLLVVQSPRPVFLAMRDQTEEAVAARQEPILAVILLAGIASVMQTSAAGALLDDPEIDGALIFVWAVLGGVVYGIASYWIGGTALYLGTRGASAKEQKKPSAVKARHVFGYAAMPVALSLLVWPVRLAIYGSDTFRTGGPDDGIGEDVFNAIGAAFLAWSFLLLVYGIRTTYGWTWLRALGTVVLSVLALLCVVVLFLVGSA